MNEGMRIKARREELGMTQDELAKKLGYKSRSSINKIELGERKLTQSKIVAIAEALDVSPLYILGLEEMEPVEEHNQSYPVYYTDPETAKAAQEVFDDPNLRMLFHAASDAKPEDIKLAADMLKRFKETNPDG